MNNNVIIRKLESNEEMRLIQTLEEKIWGMNPIPTHQTYTAVKNGGLMLGAFIDDVIVGFSYGFPGFVDGKAHLCSHMLGVHPDYQLMGIGKLLKDEQSKDALEMGYKLITWTFDPLESRNAYLNISKLYAICHTYIENCYGDMVDGLNKGLPTDRLQVEWWISSERVQQKWMPNVANYKRPLTLEKSALGNSMLQVSENWLKVKSEGFEIPVPEHFQLIKQEEPELALDWRFKIRSVFQELFEAGYSIIGVNKTKNEGVHYYQFVRRNTIPLQPK